jgi:hypothetical protein
MSFHLSLVTEEYRQVRPKEFLSLWYVWRKPCTYLASRWALSPNRPKWASTVALSPRSTVRCVQKNFWAYGTFGANHALILYRHKHCLQIDCNKITHDPRHLGVPSGAPKMIWIRKPCTYLTSRLALSPNGPKWASTRASSPRSTMRCVQKDF